MPISALAPGMFCCRVRRLGGESCEIRRPEFRDERLSTTTHTNTMYYGPQKIIVVRSRVVPNLLLEGLYGKSSGLSCCATCCMLSQRRSRVTYQDVLKTCMLSTPQEPMGLWRPWHRSSHCAVPPSRCCRCSLHPTLPGASSGPPSSSTFAGFSGGPARSSTASSRANSAGSGAPGVLVLRYHPCYG